MDEFKTFIKTWEETGSAAVILEKGLTLPPADKVQSFLSSLPDAEQAHVRDSLIKAMAALERYAVELEQEAASVKDQINQTVQSAKACLSYDTADKFKRK